MKKLMSRRGTDLCSANIRYGTNWPRRGTFAELWHDRDVIVLAQIVLRLLADMAGLRGAGGGASRGELPPTAGPRSAHAARKRFGRDARNPLTALEHRKTRAGLPGSGSVWARSPGAVRSARRKLVPLLRLSRTEPGSPSY